MKYLSVLSNHREVSSIVVNKLRKQFELSISHVTRIYTSSYVIIFLRNWLKAILIEFKWSAPV